MRKRCNWYIEVPKGQYIQLEFKYFDLGPDDTCHYEWLQIYKGGSSNSPTLTKKLCGTRMPKITVSGGNKLFLRWKSDDSKQYRGFNISVSVAGMYNLKHIYIRHKDFTFKINH